MAEMSAEKAGKVAQSAGASAGRVFTSGRILCSLTSGIAHCFQPSGAITYENLVGVMV